MEDQKIDATKEIAEKFNKAMENKASKEEIQEIKKSAKEQFDTLKKSVESMEVLAGTLSDIQKAQGKAITEQKENQSLNVDSFKKDINDSISKNFDAIQSAYKNKQTNVLVDLISKAPATITTGNATSPVAPPSIMGVQQAPPTGMNIRGAFILPMTTNVNTNLSGYPYSEVKPKDGDYGFVAEGVAKPQMDFTVETRYETPRKIAVHKILTEESVTDIPGLQSLCNELLFKRHELKKQNGLLFGDGVGENPKGATTYGRVFSSTGMSGTSGVATPTFMDVVYASITDISRTHNYVDEEKYQANLVLVNDVDYFTKLVGEKDNDNRPMNNANIFQAFSQNGITIIPERDIPAGKIFVCDMSRYNTTNYVPYSVRIGWVNNNFIENKFAIVAESRFHAFVQKLDEQAFIYDDIETIRTAITKS